MKKITIIFLTFIICVFCCTSTYALTTLYESSTEQTINSGTKLTKYNRLTDKGWLAINIIEADIKDENTTVRVLTSENGLQTFQNVKTMFSNQKNTIAAINADFFTGNYKKGNIIGMTIKDGKMLTSTYYENEIKDTLASFYIDEKDNSSIDYFTNKIILTNNRNDEEYQIAEINKWSSNYDYPVLYTKDWGEETLGLSLGAPITELIVEKNKVKEIRVGQDAVKIPENGFAICATGSGAERISEIFRVGDKVELDIDVGIDIEKIKTAISGGTILVKDGKIADFTHVIYGANPRTAIGISKDGSSIFLITVDGRQASSIGVTQEELAAIMVEKGIYTAMNLDGGGSTTMVARELGDEEPTLENSPSEGSLRMVPNAIAILNTTKTGALDKLLIEVPDVNVFVNCEKELTVKGYDKYYNPVKVDMKKIKWSYSGVEASVKNNILKAGNEAGTVTLTASVGKAKGSINIDVLSAPNELTISPKKKTIDIDESIYFEVKGQNKNGYYADLKNDEVTWKIEEDNLEKLMAKIEDGVFKASEAGSYIISATCGTATSYAVINVTDVDNQNIESKELPKDIKGVDELNTESNVSDALKVIISPRQYEGLLLERLKNKRLEKIINNDSEIVIYPYKSGKEMLSSVSKVKVFNNTYSVDNYNNLSVINVTIDNGGLRASNSMQWINLQSDIKKASKNVLIVMDGNLEDFTDKYEKQLFIDVLCDLRRSTGKNIWVIQTGENTDYSMKRGIKYLSIASKKYEDPTMDDIQDTNYIIITVTSSQMTYQIKNVF